MEQSAENFDVDNAGKDRVFQLMNKVFSVDLLLDKILDHFIHDDGKKTVRKVQDCRIVSQAWLQSINRIFRKSEKPLFVFKLNSFPETKPIDQFWESVTGNAHLDNLVPPYAIKGSAIPMLLDYFSNCGSGLIELELVEFSNVLSDPHVSHTNNFLLPRLCKFTFHLWSSNDRNKESSVMDMVKFIERIFDASKQLKSFSLFNEPCDDNDALVNSFGNLLFPSSITDLNFCTPIDSQFEALVNSSLPNLKTLRFTVNNAPLKSGLITSVLQKVRKTLQTLYVCDGPNYSRDETPTTSFQLPLMEKLKELDIDTKYFELEPGPCSALQQQLAPMLKEVTLCHHTRSTLRKWTDHSFFPNVTVLNVSMEDVREDCNNFTIFDLATMQALLMAFPNVKELSIKQISSTEMTALVFIMREMKSLHRLRITVNNEDKLQNSDIWDAILIGITQESLEALRESPELWEGLQVGNDVSVRNLTELQTLELTTGIYRGNQRPFISEVAFQYAFLKMPTLTNLILKGGFRVTMEMAEMWKRKVRTIDADIFYDEQVGDSESWTEYSDLTDD